MKDYKENAYKMGVLPKQAQQLMDWYAQKSQAIETANTKAIADQQAKGLDSLKSEWGEAFTKKADQAAFAVKKFGDEATLKFLESTGLGNHPSLIKLFAKVGESLGEDAFHGQSHGDVSTPEEIRGEVAKIMNDTSGPYWNKAHPGHAAAVAELAALNEKLYPNQKKN
jgi:hypothetical protein